MGPRVGGRGDQRRVRAAALAQARGRHAVVAARPRRARRPAALRLPPHGRPAAGAGPLVADRPRCSRPATATPSPRRRAQAELLLERYGIVTREQVLAEGIPGGFSSLYDQLVALETIGVARRGYFIEGLGGAQFALPGAVERLRAQRDDDAAPPARARRHRPRAAVRRGPEVAAARGRPARPRAQAGAYVVLAGAEPVLYVERGGKGLQVLVADGRPAHRRPRWRRSPRRSARGRIRRLALERVDGEPVVGSPGRTRLIDLGFRAGPRKLTLTA